MEQRTSHTAGAIRPPHSRDDEAPQRPPLLESGELLRGHRAIEISHNGELYRLQATRLGKLILTK
ncbi:hemin uptake protein HemP [Ramlibacter tataouinensis]|uniref:Candidate hemin uptake protein n=1 Tax=Ramlibacter tataouinensis (strain ATCC BAA-407 / DSM 14655 / LMG 21543 / TTB310) TaxID=365046 RepID=F5Y1U8_RAMTT|nr:hemin uptake protein HemP [Ramlibacter tataouinensis]AEG93532.1 Candidate hemin uptake protein [Ramlibacter tataouinensis TTB310]